MSKIIDLEKHISINSTQSIDRICQPLVSIFGVLFFRYLKLYKNGKRVILSNIPDAIRYMYEQGNWVNLWYDGNFPEFLKSGWYTWHINRLLDSREIEEKLECELISILKVNHGMTLVQEYKDYYEIFSFDAPSNTIYQADRTLLLHFAYYFKQEAKEIIKIGESESLCLAPPKIPATKELPDFVNKFLNDTIVTRYYLADSYGNTTYLTKKEITCIRWMIAGKTAEEVAIIENNTTKTIQRHIENIKTKLNCQKQSQIIKLFLDAGI